MPPIRLWTIQSPEVLDLLQQGGTYRCDISKCRLSQKYNLELSYGWMSKKMDDKGIYHPQGAQYPIFAWYTRDGRNIRPDLRRNGYADHGKRMVCIELLVDDDRTLISSPYGWELVLNGWWINPGTTSKEYEENFLRYMNCKDDELREREARESWDLIFDIGKGCPLELQGKDLQATLWEIRPEDVRGVVGFTAR